METFLVIAAFVGVLVVVVVVLGAVLGFGGALVSRIAENWKLALGLAIVGVIVAIVGFLFRDQLAQVSWATWAWIGGLIATFIFPVVLIGVLAHGSWEWRPIFALGIVGLLIVAMIAALKLLGGHFKLLFWVDALILLPTVVVYHFALRKWKWSPVAAAIAGVVALTAGSFLYGYKLTLVGLVPAWMGNPVKEMMTVPEQRADEPEPAPEDRTPEARPDDIHGVLDIGVKPPTVVLKLNEKFELDAVSQEILKDLIPDTDRMLLGQTGRVKGLRDLTVEVDAMYDDLFLAEDQGILVIKPDPDKFYSELWATQLRQRAWRVKRAEWEGVLGGRVTPLPGRESYRADILDVVKDRWLVLKQMHADKRASGHEYAAMVLIHAYCARELGLPVKEGRLTNRFVVPGGVYGLDAIREDLRAIQITVENKRREKK